MKDIILLLILIITFSCSKYEEGPLLSLRTKKSRLTDKNWVLDKVEIDNQYFYEPDSMYFTCIIGQCLLTSGGSYHIYQMTYDSIYAQGVTWVEYSGKWNFVNQKKDLDIKYTEYNYANNTKENKEIEKRILRLTDDELWFRVDINGCETIHYMKYNN